MVDYKTLPSRFTPITGDPANITPTTPDQLFLKTDSVGGDPGLYRGTAETQGSLESVVSGESAFNTVILSNAGAELSSDILLATDGRYENFVSTGGATDAWRVYPGTGQVDYLSNGVNHYADDYRAVAAAASNLIRTANDFVLQPPFDIYYIGKVDPNGGELMAILDDGEGSNCFYINANQGVLETRFSDAAFSSPTVLDLEYPQDTSDYMNIHARLDGSGNASMTINGTRTVTGTFNAWPVGNKQVSVRANTTTTFRSLAIYSKVLTDASRNILRQAD
ncbi:MAG: hypothetical protein AAF329_05610, partial [Cyanobacteria bacterium P01_A01_bin.17]